jgi:hypothetical protein
MKRFSTVQAAQKLGIHQPSLQRLIRQDAIPFPEMQTVGGIRVRLWTEQDIERARKAIKGRKRGRKPKK